MFPAIPGFLQPCSFTEVAGSTCRPLVIDPPIGRSTDTFLICFLKDISRVFCKDPTYRGYIPVIYFSFFLIKSFWRVHLLRPSVRHLIKYSEVVPKLLVTKNLCVIYDMWNQKCGCDICDITPLKLPYACFFYYWARCVIVNVWWWCTLPFHLLFTRTLNPFHFVTLPAEILYNYLLLVKPKVQTLLDFSSSAFLWRHFEKKLFLASWIFFLFRLCRRIPTLLWPWAEALKKYCFLFKPSDLG